MYTQKLNFTAKSQPVKIPYYHREYKNDLKEITPTESETPWLHQAQRLGFLALPFLSLYKPFSFPISFGMGGIRMMTNGVQLIQAIQQKESFNYELLQLTISVISLAGTIFAHPMGMIITTAHDLLIESKQLILHLEARNEPKALESALSILNNALYLAAIGAGGIELHIASLAMQILLGIYHSYTEGQKGNFPEMIAHIAMAAIRGKQLHDQCKILLMQKSFVQMVIRRSRQAKQEAKDNKSSRPLSSAHKSTDPNAKEQIHAELKQLGFDPMNMPKSGNSVLHQAAQKGNLQAVALALDYGFDISLQNNAGDTALHIAAGKGNLEIVQYLVHKGADPYTKNNLDQLAFHKGLKYDPITSYFESLGYQREIPIREWAIEQGFRPDYIDTAGNTFLHRLVKLKHHEGLKYVFQQKFCLEQLDIENKKNLRPIDVAIEQKDRGSLQLFTTYFQDRYIHHKNLFQAAHIGWKEGLEILLPFYDQKVLLNPEEGFWPEVLKETADMPEEVFVGYAAKGPLLIPIEAYRKKLLQEKYRHYQQEYPKTLLQEAAYSGDLDTVKLLTSYGCSIHQINYSYAEGVMNPRASPLSLVLYFHPENQELSEYLQKLGALEVLFHSSAPSITMESYFSVSPGSLSKNDPFYTEHFGKKTV